MLIAGWVVLAVQARPSLEQFLDYRQLFAAGLVDCGPDRSLQDVAAIHGARREGSVPPNQKPCRLQLAPVHSLVKRIQAGAGSARWIDALPEEVLSNVCPSQKADAGKGFRQGL